MRFYADSTVRRSLQVAGDVALVLWVWLWVAMARKVHDATLHLAAPGHKMDTSASDLAGRLRDAGRSVAKVPLVGDESDTRSTARVERLRGWPAPGVTRSRPCSRWRTGSGWRSP